MFIDSDKNLNFCKNFLSEQYQTCTGRILIVFIKKFSWGFEFIFENQIPLLNEINEFEYL